MARIIDIVRQRRNVIEGNKTEAEATGQLAVAALSAGIHLPGGGSPPTPTQAWRDYMTHFPDLSTAQLNRLLAIDGTENDPELKKKRAYMVANAACGTQSPQTVNLAVRVNSIDAGLPGAACDPEP
jgi:hypothetical protein